VSWAPSTGSTSFLMSMAGYPSFAGNAGNAIYFAGSQYHMYWVDFRSGRAGDMLTEKNAVGIPSRRRGVLPQSPRYYKLNLGESALRLAP
jgi:hypothetical protein